MKELKLISQQELQEILKQHLLWIKFSGKEGKRADLTGADLRWANLIEADLTGADLTGADLTGADLTGADLRWADLRWANLIGADLTGADLRWAIYSLEQLKNAIHNITIPNSKEKQIDLQAQLTTKDRKIAELEKQLKNATDETDKQSLEEQIKIESAKQEELKAKTNELTEKNRLLEVELEKEREKQKQEIGLRIGNAIKALQGSLKNTDNKIASLKNQSLAFNFIGFIILILIVSAIIVFFYFWINNPQSTFISHFLTLIENTKGISFLLVTFPTLIVFFIGLSMLKHSNKLSAEFLHYAKMKHKIELYSGLLEAAQHTAASIKDPNKAETYVEETFTKIRDKLLDSQLPEENKQVVEKDEPVSIKELAELIKIVKP